MSVANHHGGLTPMPSAGLQPLQGAPDHLHGDDCPPAVGFPHAIEGGQGSAVTARVRVHLCRGERKPLVRQARLVREEMHLPANRTERLQLDIAEAVDGVGKHAVQDRYLHLEGTRALGWTERS